MHERGKQFSTSSPRTKHPRQNINTEKNDHVIGATERQDLASSEYASNSANATTLPPIITRSRQTLVNSISEDKTTTATIQTIIPGNEPGRSVNKDLDKTSVSPYSFEHRPADSAMNSMNITPTSFTNPVDNDSIRANMGNFLDSTSFSHSVKQPTSATFGPLEKSTSPPPVTLENAPKQTTVSFLGKATSLPPIIFKHDPVIVMTSSLEETTTLPPITFDDNSQPSSDLTTAHPPIIFEHGNNQQTENSLYKTASLPPIFIDIDQNMPTTFFSDKTTYPPVVTEHEKILTGMNSSTQRQHIVTTTSQVLSSRSDVENLSQKVKPGGKIPVATKLFNPESLDLNDSNLISGAINVQEMSTRKDKSPKIVESLMSGGVVKLPFKTNSNFRFLFSSDPKVRRAKSEINEIHNRKEEAPNIPNSNKVKMSEKEFIDNNTSYKSMQKVSNIFTEKPKSPELFRTIRLPTHSTKSFIQRRKDLSKKPKRRLDLTEFGEKRLKFK